jgi:hypothetical protein
MKYQSVAINGNVPPSSARVLAGAMASPGDGSAMFCDYIALAFFAYIVRVYGGLPIKRFARGGLAPWQLQRAYEFIDGNLSADPSISDVADQCGLSSRYFSRAFKRETGISPHRWLMKRRVERAKELLREEDFAPCGGRASLRFCRSKSFCPRFFENRSLQSRSLAASPPLAQRNFASAGITRKVPRNVCSGSIVLQKSFWALDH